MFLERIAKINNLSLLNGYDLFLLGVNFIIGNAININFEAGYWMMLFNILLTGCGYILLASSLAEMTSALPFSGGIYGIVRAFLHPFAGFYVACFELLINVFYIALAVHSMSNLPIQAEYFPENSFLLNCFVIYLVILSICLLGGKVLWGSNMMIGITCLVIILIYILGSIPHANFSSWNHADEAFNANLLLKYLPKTSLSFLGIQYLPLTSKLVTDSQKTVPWTIMATIAVLFPIIVAVITVASSITPGHVELALEDHPLIFGFSEIFGTSIIHSHFFGLPGLLSTCFSFMYCFGRQASTMAGSGLLPSSFLWTLPGFGTPFVPLIGVAILSFILDVFAYIWDIHAERLFMNICCMSTYIVFIFFFAAYIQFSRNYSSLQRHYHSPFGIVGAVLGILIFTLCMVADLGFQESYDAIILLFGLSVLIVLAFKFILKGSHTFSEEEKNELFKAYLITANKMTKDRLKRRATNSQSKGSASANSRGSSSHAAGSSAPGSSSGGGSISSKALAAENILQNSDSAVSYDNKDMESLAPPAIENRLPDTTDDNYPTTQNENNNNSNSIWSVHLINNKVQPQEI